MCSAGRERTPPHHYGKESWRHSVELYGFSSLLNRPSFAAAAAKTYTAPVLHRKSARIRNWRTSLKETVIIVGIDHDRLSALSSRPDGLSYAASTTSSAHGLAALSCEHCSGLIILRLDTIPVDNLLLPAINRERSSVNAFVFSPGSIHHERQGSGVSYVDVGLSKHIKPAELPCPRRSVFKNGPPPRAGPDSKAETTVDRVHHFYCNIQGDEEMPQ